MSSHMPQRRDQVDGAESSSAVRSGSPWQSILFSWALIVICWFTATVTVSFEGQATWDDGQHVTFFGWYVFWWLLACLASISLLWRKRAPFVVTILLAVVAFLPGTEPTAALIALSVLVMLRKNPAVWAVTALVTAAAFVTLWHSAHLPPERSVLKMLNTPNSAYAAGADVGVAAWIPIGLTILAVGVSVVVGLFRRSRDDLAQARSEGAQERAAGQQIKEEMSRQQERERLAREMHDTLAHRLSLAAMHSGSLEVTAATDPTAAIASARGVGDNVRKALDDLRHIMGVMRDPSALSAGLSEAGSEPKTLTALPDLIENSLDAGVEVRPVIYLYDAAYVDPDIGHTAYRVVQEALTNVHKHAPDAVVDLSVRGGPTEGIRVRVANPLPTRPAQDGASGSGQGLTGMRERIELVGGQLTAGPQGDIFVIDAWLPWQPIAPRR